MLPNNKPVPADNGQIFLAEDVEVILSDYFRKDSNGINMYSRCEILEDYNISERELDRMLYRLSYDYRQKQLNNH